MKKSAPKPTAKNQRLPNILYHYTSIAGLESIIVNKFVWATHIGFMNDSQEYRYALALVKRLIKDSRTWTEDQKSGLGAMYEIMNVALGDILGRSLCAFCLSEDGDLLSQWRAYCPPEGGYSIGFRRNDLGKWSLTQHFGLAPCTYDPSEQEKILAALLQKVADRMDGGIEKLQGPLREFLIDLEIRAGLFKHPRFSEEKEWRVSSNPHAHPKLNYRIARTVAVPALRLALGTDSGPFPIGEIIVGPSRHQELALRGVQNLLLAQGYDEDLVARAVKGSNIPYRVP